MPMNANDIETLILEALPDAQVEIRDLAGDGDHYAAKCGLRSVSAASPVSSSTRWSMMR
jgi:acid stress-induced BolA-like protein IbaG/YrbA